jgi:membrane-bound serine protease (ClpP class)
MTPGFLTARRRTGSGFVLIALALMIFATLVSVVGTAATESANATSLGADTGTQGSANQIAQAPATADSSTSATAVADVANGDPGFVAVVEAGGLLDPVLMDFLRQSIVDAEAEGATALVFQVNSDGVVVDDSALGVLLTQMLDSSVPIAVWVGPSGSSLTSAAAQLVGAADQVGMAPGTRLGNAGAPIIDGLDLRRLDPIRDQTVGSQEAADLGITTAAAPTIGDFVVNLPGVRTREVPAENGETRREPITQVRFGQLSLFSQLMHTVASPAVAYLLLTVGLALIIFELFTAGVGVAGVVGAGSFILAGYGLGVLPIRWWGLVLIGLSMVAFAIDVQTGVPRFWTGAGVVMFVVGSLALYDGVSLSWITLGFAIISVVLAFVAGMPSMVRTRFSTPTIGREWMIGEVGRAVSSVDPDGVVQIRDALWRASTNRATPIEELESIRVVAIDGLVLEVEPESGGAKDYRDRSGGEAPSAD